VAGRLVLVGDAGGTCHPLTATGMTMCVNDALRLRDALLRTDGDFARALSLYEHDRRWPQATRLVLADALHAAFCGVSPELQVVRQGILMHWRASASARAATMALLTTIDPRPLSLVRQMATVLIRGLRAPKRVERAGRRSRLAELNLWLRLVGYFASQLRQMIGAFWATYSVGLRR
jgi:flavin-dependent dehydrogenase